MIECTWHVVAYAYRDALRMQTGKKFYIKSFFPRHQRTICSLCRIYCIRMLEEQILEDNITKVGSEVQYNKFKGFSMLPSAA